MYFRAFRAPKPDGRALALTGARPGMLDVDLSDLPPLLRSAARRFPILTLYTEARDPSVCAIGRPQRIGGGKSSAFVGIAPASAVKQKKRAGSDDPAQHDHQRRMGGETSRRCRK